MRLIICTIAMLLCSSVASAKDLTVATQGRADHRTIQAAVDALSDDGGTVRIAPGRYREKLRIYKNNVHLLGLGKRPQDVVLVYDDSAKTAGGTFKSATLDASGDDLRLTNLTVQNDWGTDPANPPSQAVALALTGDRAVIDRVRLLGHQDTLYANRGRNKRPARQYFRDCYIEGHVDFIFGDANAYFDRCHLHGVAHEAVMFTAQSRNAPDDDSAYIFNRAHITADPGAGEISLGRAWRPYARVIFLHTRIDAPVMKQGWREWTPGKTDTLGTAYFAEYRSTGPGASPNTREPRSHQLTPGEAKQWTLPAFFKGDIVWTR